MLVVQHSRFRNAFNHKEKFFFFNKSIIEALCISKTQKTLCTCLAHLHEHKATCEELSNLDVRDLNPGAALYKLS